MKFYRLILCLVIASCSAAKFKAPEVDLPKGYIYGSVNSNTVSIEWWEVFGDTTLTSLIEEALLNNTDIEIAISQLTQAKLLLQNARVEGTPTLSLEAEGTATKTGTEKVTKEYYVEPTLSWEIDFFGKYRYASKAQRAEMMASAENLNALRLSVAAEVASSYFTILEYDLSSKIAQQTLSSRQESATLTSLLFEYGEATLLEIEQNNGLIATAQVALENYTLARNKAILSLNTLLGRNPTEMEVDGTKLLNYTLPKEIPSVLPASLLEQRPDIKEAYYGVEAAYAKVGVAIASRLPSFTLTAEGGTLTTAFTSLFKSGTYGWEAAASLVAPLFSFGTLKRNVKVAEEEKVQSLLSYKDKVITALSEVESALCSIELLKAQRLGQSELVRANKEYQKLSEELYRGGTEDFLSVLDAEREYFSSELSYATLLSDELSAYVSLYKALGGGY